jgi:beta-glucosidase
VKTAEVDMPDKTGTKNEIQKRTAGLLSEMTLDEKIAQLGSVYATPLLKNDRLAVERAEEYLANGIGQISALGRTSELPAGRLADLANDIQHFLVEKTRLGIPAIIHEECLNGFRAKGATIFPQNIGLASSWDPELVGRITDLIREQMRACGVHQGLAPVLDVARDPRWGRIEETFGEDPYLVTMMGLAYVRGLQGDDLTRGVVATIKHFAGHGLPEGGLNCAPAHIPPRLLREVYLAPFEKAVREGGVLSLMNAYHEIDGIPCGASEELLTGILREEWDFDGLVVSDYYAIEQFITNHRLCTEKGEAAGIALNAGIDLELPRTDCFGQALKEQVEQGKIPMKLVDRAVTRVLDLKYRLGLFDNPYVKSEAAPKVFDTAAHREIALEAARKSIVLLKNEGGILPLAKNTRNITVIGPNANSKRNLLGDYTYPSNAGYEIATNPETGKAEVFWKDRTAQQGKIDAPVVVTILEGIKAVVGKKTKVVAAEGCDYNSADRSRIPEAAAAAKSADVAVIVIGGKSGLLPDCTCGEMRDREELGLLGVQEDLVKAVYETGTPVVLVIVDGRPLTLGWIAEKIPAIVEAWLPGEEGGNAVADVLFGNYNPGGKLAASFPAKIGQIPAFYNHKPSGRRSSTWDDYVEGSTRPSFEFGHGLSYTTFAFSNLKISPRKANNKGIVSIALDVKNTGEVAGDEVVQLYVNDVVASVTRPVKELKGFQRVHLQPGETMSVIFKLPVDELAFYDQRMVRLVEPGLFKVMVGYSSVKILLEGEFTVKE